jgi:His Kinase A (phospho-acceptor) domain
MPQDSGPTPETLGDVMNASADMNIEHNLNSALTKISVALQLLDRRTPLSEQQRQFVNAALNSLTDLQGILRDDAHRQLTGLPPVLSNN